jgi:nicotinate-nucleotide adenylyltransferase
MRLGIFGGTFDPPHLGHLILAAEASAQLGLERVLWVLTPYPPHKVNQPITSLEDRLDLLMAALDDDPAFELSRVDIDRPAPHYAVDTLGLLREQYPQAMLVYLMGGDSLVDLPLWHRPGDFVHSCDEIAVMLRRGHAMNLDILEARLPGLRARARLVRAPLLEISSSDVRRRIARGQPFRYLITDSVYQLVNNRHLYREA